MAGSIEFLIGCMMAKKSSTLIRQLEASRDLMGAPSVLIRPTADKRHPNHAIQRWDGETVVLDRLTEFENLGLREYKVVAKCFPTSCLAAVCCQ